MPRIKNQEERERASEPDFSSRLKEAKQQLDLLRGQQELVEREQNQLEELKGLTEELENEKRSVTEKLSSAIIALEKKEHALRISQQETLSLKNELENISDEIQIAEKKSQKIDDVREKVTFEKQAVENAKSFLEKTSGRLGFINEKEYDFEDEPADGYSLGRDFPDFSGFMEGFKSGVGFFAAGLIAAAIFYIIFIIAGR